MKLTGSKPSEDKRFRVRRWPGRLTLALALLLPFNAGWASQADTLRIGVYQNEPKIFINSAGKPDGFFVRLLEEIARQEAWELQFVPGTWEECLNRLKSGDLDILPDVALTRARSRELIFQEEPVLTSWSQVYAADKHKIRHLSDLTNKRVAVLNGSVQQSGFRQLMNGLGIPFEEIPVETMLGVFVEIQLGHADAGITNHLFGARHMADYPVHLTPLIWNPAALYFTTAQPANQAYLNTIDHYITRWKDSPQSIYYELLQQYMPWLVSGSATSGRWLYVVLAIVFIALAAGLIFAQNKLVIKSRRQISDMTLQLTGEAEKFRSYLEHAPLGVFIINHRGEIIQANRKATELTGYSRQELVQMQITTLVPEYDHAAAQKHFRQLRDSGESSDTFSFLRKNGTTGLWDVHAVRITDDRMIGFALDVTDKEKVKRELEDLKNHLEAEVAQKTSELQQRIGELEAFHEMAINREIRMKELSEELDALKKDHP